MIVIGNMLGVAPEDRDDLLRWSDDMLKALGSPDPTAMDRAAMAAMEYAEYITAVAEQRRRDQPDRRPHRDPGPRRDRGGPARRGVAHLRVAADPDRRGRDHPPRHQRGHVRAAHPSRPARSPGRRPGPAALAVEEMLRWVSPIKNMARTMTRDVELHGETLRQGQKLLLLYPSANRDERVFDDPETFDITRTPTTTWPSGSAPTSAWATGWPAWSWR